MIARTSICVGALYWRTIREYLRRQKFEHPEIEYFESSGWVQREFIVRGPETPIRQIHSQFAAWERQVEEQPI